MKEIETKLIVNGIFNMSFGKTFFTGILQNNDNLIEKSKWQLLVNGKPIKKVEIEGEQIVKKVNEENKYRTLATSKIINFIYDLNVDKIELILLN